MITMIAPGQSAHLIILSQMLQDWIRIKGDAEIRLANFEGDPDDRYECEELVKMAENVLESTKDVQSDIKRFFEHREYVDELTAKSAVECKATL